MFNFIQRYRAKRATLKNPPEWLVNALAGGPSTSGVTVNDETAVKYSAFFACIRILANGVAGLPLVLYRRKPDGSKERATGHPLYNIVRRLFNPEMSSFRARSVMQAHLAAWGNAYGYKEYNGAGKVAAVWPLQPKRMTIERKNGRLNYYHNSEPVPTERILHIAGFGFDGVMGKSVLSMFREVIGLGLATEEFGARFFGNGTHPGAVVEHPGILSDDAKKKLFDSLQEAYSGLGKTHKLLILEEGMKIQKIGVPPDDAQFLETRKFQVNEIARIFQIPPHMLGDLERATFSNIEHQSIEFVVHTIRPWLVLWEEELSRVLLTPEERAAGLFFEHLIDGLLRGDIKSRYDAYAVGRMNGWLSANDIRRMENMNPIENGDTYLVPLNMVSADMLDQVHGGGGGDGLRAVTATTPDIPLIEFRALLSGADNPVMDRIARVQDRHEKRLVKTAQTVVNYESGVVRSAIKQTMPMTAADADQMLVGLYRAMPGQLKKKFQWALWAYQDDIAQGSLSMVGGRVGEKLRRELQRFKNEYLENLAKRHAGKSLADLRRTVEGSGFEDIAGALDRRLSAWEENRAEQIYNEESVRAAWATSRESWKKIGVTRLKWVAHPGCCPWCQKINGRIVGIDDQFLGDGEVITAKDENDNWAKMKISGRKSHPPIHKGCRCGIDPIFSAEYRKGETDDRRQMSKFIDSRDKLPEHLMAFVTRYTAKQYRDMKASVYLSEDGRSGFAIKPDGDLISVFSLPGAHAGHNAVRTAIKEGARKLDCLGTFLAATYAKYGFEEYDRLPWDDQYAPENWDYEKFGKPDVIMMKRDDETQDRKKPDQRKKTPETEAFRELSKEFVDMMGLDPEKENTEE